MSTLFVLRVEPRETRYTSEWCHYVPAQIAGYAKNHEQYGTPFLYPSEWIKSWEADLRHKDGLVAYVRMMMADYASPKMQAAIVAQEQALKDRFLTATPDYRNLVGA